MNRIADRITPCHELRCLLFSFLFCCLFSISGSTEVQLGDTATTSVIVVLSSEAEKFIPGDPVLITTHFSEPVQDFSAEDISIGGCGGRVSDLNGDGVQYQFQVLPTPGAKGAVAIFIRAMAVTGKNGKASAESNILRVSSEEDIDPSLKVYLNFDENEGVRALDTTPFGNDGILSRGPRVNDGFSFASHAVWGVRRGALHLDGSVAEVSIPPLRLNSNTVTMAAWIRREEGAPMAGSGIIFSNGTDPDAPSNGSPCGLTIEDVDELNYCWGDNLITYQWRSGLKVPANKWVHAALVISPNGGRIYLTENGLTRSIERRAPHPIMPFNRITRVGTNWGYALFKGSIDEVRIYNRSLNAEDIAALANLPKEEGAGQPSASPLEAIIKRSAIAGWPYLASIACSRPTPGAFHRISGPAWLQVASDGTLSGTPSATDTGTSALIVRSKEKGIEKELTAQITVLAATQAIEISSPVNPVWVEGAVDPQAVELAGILNNSIPVRIVRQSPSRWYADYTEGGARQAASRVVPAGILLPSNNATLTVIARYSSGAARRINYNLSLSPTDLSEKNHAKDLLTLRRGDTLSVTATGPGSALEVVDSTGIYQNLGTPGSTKPIRFDRTGIQTLFARIDKQERGSMRVRVLDINLSDSGKGLACDNDKPIALEKGFAREKFIRVEPVSAANDVFFTSNDPAYMSISMRGALLPTTTCLSLQGYALSTTATVELQARLNGPEGPLAASHPVVCFEITSTAETRAPVIRTFDDGSSLCSATLSVRPPVPGLDFHMILWGKGGTFADSRKDLYFTSSDLDAQGDYLYGMIQPGNGSLNHSLYSYQDGIPVNKRN